MKKIIIAALVFAAGLGMAQPADAQGLGELLKKGKEVLQQGHKVLEQTGVSATQNEVQPESAPRKTMSVSGANNIEVINPLSPYIDVLPVGLFAVDSSENYGEAYLVLKVMMKMPGDKVIFGTTNHNEKFLAVDPSGTVFNIDSSGGMGYDTPEGIQVTVKMDEPQMRLKNIKKGTEVMPMVKLGAFINGSHRGQLTFKNVPVYWNRDPE